MQVKLDDEVIFEIDDMMISLLEHEIINPVEDIKRRLRWIIEHKCDQCYARMEEEYKSILINDPDILHFPKSKREMAKLIVSHKDYKNRAQREKEAVEKQNG